MGMRFSTRTDLRLKRALPPVFVLSDEFMKAILCGLPTAVFTFVLLNLLPGELFAQQEAESPAVPAALNFTMENLAGEEVELSDYEGKVVLFVNVASKCGLTPQYEALQALHEEYAEQGLAIVGVPCRQFGGQEFKENEAIAEFCEENYGVGFDMMSRVDVNGEDQCGLYAHLTSLDLEPTGAGEISWNFEKFLLDRSGTPIARFAPRTKPGSEPVLTAIRAALAEGGEQAGQVYSHRSDLLGREYFLFSKDVVLKNSDKTRTIYFFAKDPNSDSGTPLSEVPTGYEVSETKTGMLVLKKSK